MCVPRRGDTMFENPEVSENVVCSRNQLKPTQHNDERQALTKGERVLKLKHISRQTTL